MKRDIVPDARKRLNDLSREAAVQFESSIVHNRVWERISEDDSLRQLLDVAEISERAVEDAFNEACAWLAEHPGAAARNEIDVDETVWGEEVVGDV